MSWTFNPPPGWPPQPEGWQPPPGWVPDPSWPPAPPGWQFWVPAGSAPTVAAYPGSTTPYPTTPYSATPPTIPASPAPYPPAGYGGSYPPAGYAGGPQLRGKPWYQQGWVIGVAAAAAVVLLTGVVGVGTFILLRSDDDPSTPTSGPTANTTSEPTPAQASPDPDTKPPPPSGDAQNFEGRGSEVIELDLADGQYYTATITHTGSDWFEVWSMKNGQEVTSLGWGYGSYTGTYGLGLFPDEEVNAIRIETSGSWTVEVRDLAESPDWPEQSEGTGSTVLQVDPTASEQAITGTHDGESNFIVWCYVKDDHPSLLYNEVGPYSGSAVLPSGAFVLTIQADGDWTVEED